MKNFKKTISIICVFALLLALVPQWAISANAENTESMEMHTRWQPNPLYEGVVDESLLEQVPVTYSRNRQTEYLDREMAAGYIRQQMVLRNGTITVSLIDSVYSTQEAFDGFTGGLLDEALAHTGIPNEGDYLMWQYGGFSCTGSYYIQDDLGYYTLTYTIPYYTTREQEEVVDEAVDTLLNNLDLYDKSDYEKLLAIYDYICENVEYDYAALENPGEDLLTFTAYGALIENSSVCQGYANLLYRLSLEAGIDNRLIPGVSFDQNHGWNIAKLDSFYYNLDSTWDAGQDEYSYFLKCEDDFANHVRKDEYTTESFHSSYPMAEINYNPDQGGVVGGEYGSNAVWELKNGVLTVDGEGNATYSELYSPWSVYSDEINSVYVGEGITEIRLYAFRGVAATEAYLPESLTTIGSEAFFGCPNLQTITIPKNVINIQERVFAASNMLTSIEVEDDNAVYEDIDGVLFHKDDKVLVEYPCAQNAYGTYTVPQGTVMIGKSAFYWSKVAKVELPNTLISIGEGAFTNCMELTSITIPASVTSISNGAFSTVNNEAQIIFCGDAPEFLGNPFIACNAKCYYPADNSTWDAIANEGFGTGTDWVPYEKLEDIPTQNNPGGSGGTGGGFIEDDTDITEDNLTWTYENGVLTISGEGPMKDYSQFGTPWNSHLGEISSIIIEPGVTSIGKYSFYCCGNLSSVSIPNTVTKIKDGAFECCDKLTAVALPDSITSIGLFAFSSCKSLIDVDLPNGLVKLAGSAFSATGITQITIPESLQIMGEGVFRDCSNLQKILVAEGNQYFQASEGVLYGDSGAKLICYPAGKTATEFSIPGNVTNLGSGAFAGANNLVLVAIPKSAINWDAAIFAGCTSLKKVNIPDGVTSIGACMFEDCHSLENVVIPDGVTSIGNGAFFNAYSLKEIIMPEGVTTLGVQVFQGCSGLKNVVLPDSLETTGHNTFAECRNLTKVTLGSGLSNLGDDAFFMCDNLVEIVVSPDNPIYAAEDGVLFANDKQILVCYLRAKSDKTYKIPESVTTIGKNAFNRNDYLENLLIPASVQTIEESAMAYCSALSFVRFSNGLTSLNNHIFYGCENLKTISLPDTLQCIGNYVFAACNSLESIEIPESVTAIGEGAFDSCKNLREITLPDGIVEIANYLFNGCEALENVEIPDSVERIGVSAFHACLELKEIKFPSNLKVIDYAAFTDCKRIQEVLIPAMIDELVPYLFYGCDSLHTVIFVGDAPSTIQEHAFYENTATVYYPGENPTWTENIMQDYGGDLNWVAFSEECQAGDHRFTQYYSNGDATCGADGTKTAYCDRHCGASNTVTDAGTKNANTHVYGNWINVEGAYQRSCTICGHTESKLVTSGGDVDVSAPEQPNLNFDAEYVETTDERYVLVEEAFADKPEDSYEILKTFDINLENEDGVHVQPNGTVKVKLPLDSEQDGNYKVYRVNEDGTITDMKAYRQGSHVVFETDHFSIYVLVAVAGYDITGMVTSAGDEAAEITIQLIDSDEAVAYTTTVVGNNAVYTLNGVMEGTYTLKATKTGHAVSTCTVVVGAENITQDITLWQIGDVNSDGKVNSIDRVYLARYLAKWTDYPESVINMAAADVNGDGAVNALDRVYLARHLAKWSGYETLGG